MPQTMLAAGRKAFKKATEAITARLESDGPHVTDTYALMAIVYALQAQIEEIRIEINKT